MPGNLPAAGAAPHLCPCGKQEEDGKGGWRKESEGREDAMEGLGVMECSETIATRCKLLFTPNNGFCCFKLRLNDSCNM